MPISNHMIGSQITSIGIINSYAMVIMIVTVAVNQYNGDLCFLHLTVKVIRVHTDNNNPVKVSLFSQSQVAFIYICGRNNHMIAMLSCVILNAANDFTVKIILQHQFAAGAGKSSLAKRLAKDLGYVYVDTGAMYRSIGLYAVRAGVDPKDEAAVTALLPQIKLAIRLMDGAQHIYLNGEDVSDAIRAENIGMAASAVSAHPPVRAFLLDTQRGLAADQNILMDGRDIGTVVLPNATVKIFLTASAEARAERRRKELEEKGQPADFATVLADIRQRDYQDTHRAIAPLKQADDAILVDTSDIGFDESFELLKRTILAHI